MKFSVQTLGCKVNSYESEALISFLKEKGWDFVKKDPDVIIINTCTVTSTSDQKSRQMIRKAKRENEKAIVVAMGCFTQLNKDVAGTLADIVIGTNNRLKVYDLVMSYLDTKKEIDSLFNVVDDVLVPLDFEEMKVNAVETHTRGFVKIQDGCENYCSYCAIPYSRGKIRSRNPNDVVDEINRLVANGTKEVIIAGINTGTYGEDTKSINLAQLIEKIMKETSLYRLRLSSIELMNVTSDLLDVMEKYASRIANHLHIPLQGGCDSVLQRMNRKYLTNDFRLLLYNIRKRFKDIAITTDFLGGFVGETEEEFRSALAFIKEMKFASMHIFPYSRRKNTKADELEGHLDPKLINERTHILLDAASSLKREYEKTFDGRVLDVLTEQLKNGYFISHSSNYLEVKVKDDGKIKENMIVKVKLEVLDNEIIGRRV